MTTYYVDKFGLTLIKRRPGGRDRSASSRCLRARWAASHPTPIARRQAASMVARCSFSASWSVKGSVCWRSRRPDSVVLAIIALMATFGLFVHMACGATYALVPFVDRTALGGVTGIVGAGGNIGGVAAGFLLKGVGNVQQTMFILGAVVLVTSLCAIAVRFSSEKKANEQRLYEEAIAQREALGAAA